MVAAQKQIVVCDELASSSTHAGRRKGDEKEETKKNPQNLHKSLKWDSPDRPGVVLLIHIPCCWFKTHPSPPPNQLTPVTRLSSRCQVPVPEGSYAVQRYPLRSLRIVEEFRNLRLQVREVFLDLDKVLISPLWYQEDMVWLQPSSFVHHNDRVAILQILAPA